MTTQEEKLKTAIAIATEAHKGQTRWDNVTPYISHPLAVMSQFKRPYERMVAVLHDVIEDTKTTAGDLLSAGIPDDVVNAVYAMSHVKGQSYALYLGNVKANSLASKIKTADILHNLSDLDRKRNKQRFDKYLLALKILNPKTLKDLTENQVYRHQKVFSLNTGVRGTVAHMETGKEGLDIQINWDNGEISDVWHYGAKAVGVIEV